jgi:hypothetical protein
MGGNNINGGVKGLGGEMTTRFQINVKIGCYCTIYLIKGTLI